MVEPVKTSSQASFLAAKTGAIAKAPIQNLLTLVPSGRLLMPVAVGFVGTPDPDLKISKWAVQAEVNARFRHVLFQSDVAVPINDVILMVGFKASRTRQMTPEWYPADHGIEFEFTYDTVAAADPSTFTWCLI